MRDYTSNILAALAVAGLALIGSAAGAETFKRITKEDQFRSLVVGKKGVSEMGWFIVHADGTTTGNILKKKFSAAWVWKNRMYCRNAVLGKDQLGTDCQVVKISGDKVQFIRKYGKGPVGVSTLQ